MAADSSSLVLPKIQVKVVADHSPEDPTGFLRLRRRTLRVTYEDGTESRNFLYDEVTRKAVDAVVLCAYYFENEVPFIYLRSAVRPPVTFRDPAQSPVAEGLVGLYELPAGLIEPDEQSEAGVLACAARELKEELGFSVPPGDFVLLGPSAFPCPGVISERHFYLRVAVEPTQRAQPALDGSALEEAGRVVAVPLTEALEACRRGELPDAKTELGLRRLEDSLR